MVELSYLSAFLVGLLGGTHCIGMCGGIVGALSLQMPGQATPWRFLLGYNGGRIVSYTAGGFLAGAVGSGGLLLNNVLPVQLLLYGLASLLLIALGLYLAGLWQAVVYIERAGSWLWKKLQPYTKHFLPVQSVPQSFALGLLWGWLPCGLVYSVLVLALASGSALKGGILMLAFGLGTLPNLLAMGLFARQIKAFMQQKAVRTVAGLLVAGFGVLGLVRLAGF
ncbi:MAG: sulfite exporter TauE/SafE family protein [Sulfuricellaceae bacterium]|jgi:sulfite exporter TauE/SafE